MCQPLDFTCALLAFIYQKRPFQNSINGVVISHLRRSPETELNQIICFQTDRIRFIGVWASTSKYGKWVHAWEHICSYICHPRFQRQSINATTEEGGFWCKRAHLKHFLIQKVFIEHLHCARLYAKISIRHSFVGVITRVLKYNLIMYFMTTNI